MYDLIFSVSPLAQTVLTILLYAFIGASFGLAFSGDELDVLEYGPEESSEPLPLGVPFQPIPYE